MKNLPENFASEISARRVELGLTLEEVAAGICSVSYLSMLEAGKRSPSAKILRELSYRLEYSFAAGESSAAVSSGAQKALLAIRMGDFEGALVLAQGITSSLERDLILAIVDEKQGFSEKASEVLIALNGNPNNMGQSRMFTVTALLRALLDIGDFHHAIQVGEEAISELDELNWPDEFFEIKATLSRAYIAVNEFHRALRLVQSSTNTSTSSLWQQVMQHWAQLSVYDAAGENEKALETVGRALDVLKKIDAPIAYANMVQSEAWLRLKLGQDISADIFSDIEFAERILRERNHQLGIAQCLDTRARAEAIVGDKAKVDDLISEALSIVTSEQAGARALMLVSTAQTYHLAGDDEKTLRNLVEARSLLESQGANRAEAQTWTQMAELYEQLDDIEAAMACYKVATELVGLKSSLQSSRTK